MTDKTEQVKQKSFYLHSLRNRRLYSASDYPLSHLLDRFNVDRHVLKQSSYVEHFRYAFLLLVIWTLIGVVFFRLHIQVYNTIFGPFHFTQEQFVDYVNTYDKDWSFVSRLWKIEYIQVELYENNIQNPSDTYDTIRQFANPRTRRDHIATYKRIKRPAIYVKLPTQSRKHFHARHRIHFQSYSIRTLQCIVKNLPVGSTDTYRTWLEKSEYIQHIDKEYAKNSTEFNKAVLTKCGVLIGYIYRPKHEKAFIPTAEHTFKASDLVLNMTEEYYSFYTFLICGLIFIWLFLKSLFYLIRYLIKLVHIKILHRFGIFSFSLVLLPDVVDELWLLNTDGYPHEQLLQLDKFIRTSEQKYSQNLFIIRNNHDQIFVVILKVNLHVNSNVYEESSPFVICPVTDIQKITQYGGICYGKDASWIEWPTKTLNEDDYAGWLHEQLMETSQDYKQRYEERLRYERDDQLPSYFTGQQLRVSATQRGGARQRSLEKNTRTANNGPLSHLIREENNIQRLRIERQNVVENIQNLYQPIRPAAARFIARFRLEHEHNKKVVNVDMANEQIECTLCQESLNLGESYARWPCPGVHVFHYDCMLKSLRIRNTCPNCRHEIEGVLETTTQAILGQFLSRLLM